MENQTYFEIHSTNTEFWKALISFLNEYPCTNNDILVKVKTKVKDGDDEYGPQF